MNNKTIKIYADRGTFSTIKEAAFLEKQIKWNKDNIQCDICSECFAAYKLYEYLKKAGIENISFADEEDIFQSDVSIVLTGRKTGGKIIKTLGLDKEEVFPKTLTSEDGYVIQHINDGNKIILLSGNSRIAVMYAMYHYLKLAGFSFISPDKAGFIIPKISEVPIPKKIKEQPDYITRGFLSGYSDDKNKNFFEWMVANRLNYMSLSVKDYDYVKKLGIMICGGGHRGMYEYLPPDKPDPNYIPKKGGKSKTYFETHPEWFAMINGKRDMGVNKGAAAKGYYTGNNFCTSNKEAVKEFCKNYLKAIIDGPLKHADIINIWPLDNGKWCECDECKKLGNYSRRILLLAYTMMKYIKDAIKEGLLKRDIMLMVPAYHETLPEPDKPLPKDFDYDMCVVTLFTIERCYVHDLFDTDCTEANTILADRIKEWTTKENRNYKGDLVIGEYFNVSSFASIPVVLNKRISKDIPDYYNIGAKHFNFMHMITENWGAKIVNNNLYAALLWDIDLDSKEYINNILKLFYKDNLNEIKGIYSQLEKGFENSKYIFHYQFVDGKINALRRNIKKKQPFVSKHVKYDEILDDKNAGIDFLSGLEEIKKAKEKIAGLMEKNEDPKIKERLVQLKTHIQYGLDLYNFYRLIIRYSKAQHNGNKQKCVKIAKELKLLNENCTAYRWALAGYKSQLMFFESLAAASWQKQLYEKIIDQEDLSNANAELSL